MLNTIKYLLFILVVAAFFSCSKDEVKNKLNKMESELAQEDDDTTALAPPEAFSQALVNNILDNDDEDLQVYLEDEIYPMVQGSNKVTIDKISSSIFLFQYEEKGSIKNIIIQKFYNPSKDEFFFEKREVQNDAVKQFVK